MATPNFKRTRLACYTAYFTMSSVFCLPPLLFATLQDTFGISYTLLGTLVLVNFCTQLSVDLLLSLISKKIDVKWIVKIMPVITTLGLVVYALIPTFFPNIAYLGLILGTFIFSVAAGLSEVLLSPIIAAMPSDNPQKDMSALHSLYAFGVFTVVVVSTVFFAIFTSKNWMYLTLFFAILPLISAVLFWISPFPELNKENQSENIEKSKKKHWGIILCVACIFFGSCAENTMSNWVSSFMENALKIDKSLGDILGMAGFALLLGFTRIGYSKYGKNITNFLLFGMIGATVCYLTVGLVPNAIVCFIACILTGIFTAMLWPGALIMMEEKIPNVGVASYALMAAGGDLGASIAPQLLGIVTDSVAGSSFGANIGLSLNMTAEQVGLKVGMLTTAIFPLLGVITLLIIIKKFGKKPTRSPQPLQK